jgi:chromosome segregation ATPase
MIQKIRDLIETKEHIDQIKNNLKYTTNSVSELKNEINSLRENVNASIDDMGAKNAEFLKEFKENTEIISNVRHDFEKEIFQFKLLKAQLQKKILEKFEEELDQELKLQMDNLKSDSEIYNELKENIKEISAKVNGLSGEIEKFKAISQNIKREDFELTKFAKHLLEMDKEKLELMRKIDTLERLVSKIRRHEYVTR